MLQTVRDGVRHKVWLGGNGDPMGIVQATRIQPYRQMIFWDKNGSPNLGQNGNQPEQICHLVAIVFPADHRKLKRPQK